MALTARNLKINLVRIQKQTKETTTNMYILRYMITSLISSMLVWVSGKERQSRSWSRPKWASDDLIRCPMTDH